MKKCPKCKLINPDEVEECDCGYSFITGLFYERNNELHSMKKPIIQVILTAFFAMVIVCLLCTYNSVGFFINYWYHFKGIIGVYILWLITIVSIAVSLIPTVISWIVFYRKCKTLRKASVVRKN